MGKLDTKGEGKMLTESQFLNQFPVRIRLSDEAVALLELDSIAYDKFPVYRCLNRLFVLREDGEYYGAY